jgi:hypothetical protein
MTSDRAALREKVARAIMKAWVNGRSTPDDFVSTATDAAIDLVLEEAARVAAEKLGIKEGCKCDECSDACDAIAAIRALITPGKEEREG